MVKNYLGTSWSVDGPVNLIKVFPTDEKVEGTYWAVCCTDKPEVVKEFKITNFVEYSEMMDLLKWFNNYECELCPIVKMEMDWTS